MSTVTIEAKPLTERIVHKFPDEAPKNITPLDDYQEKYNGFTLDEVADKDSILAAELKRWGYVGMYVPSSRDVIGNSDLVYDPLIRRWIRGEQVYIDVTGHFIIINKNSPKAHRLAEGKEGTDIDGFSDDLKQRISKIHIFYEDISAFRRYIDDFFPCTQHELDDKHHDEYEQLKKRGCLDLVPSSLFEISRISKALEHYSLMNSRIRERLNDLESSLHNQHNENNSNNGVSTKTSTGSSKKGSKTTHGQEDNSLYGALVKAGKNKVSRRKEDIQNTPTDNKRRRWNSREQLMEYCLNSFPDVTLKGLYKFDWGAYSTARDRFGITQEEYDEFAQLNRPLALTAVETSVQIEHNASVPQESLTSTGTNVGHNGDYSSEYEQLLKDDLRVVHIR